MKKIRLIFLFLGIFLLSSMAAGVESCASYTAQPTLTSDNTYYSNVLDLNKSDTNYYHFTISTPGTIEITVVSGGSKVKMNYSESICPPTDENNTGTLVSHTVTSGTSFDFNLGLYATNTAEYNLTVNFIPAPLAITKTAFPSQVEENNATTVTYTIVVENHSSGALENINLKDSLPSPFTDDDIVEIRTGSSGWVCNMEGAGSFSSTNLECNLTSLARETTASAIEIVMKVDTASDIVNTADVTATDEDTVSSSATIRAVTGTKPVDLDIQKFAEAEIIPPDTNFTYVIFVTNHSQSADAELVTVTDIFPSDGNVSFVSYDRGSGWDCDIAKTPNNPIDPAGTFTCYFDRSMGHEITYFTIRARTRSGDYNTTNVKNIVTVDALNPLVPVVDTIDHNHTYTAPIDILTDINASGGGGSIGRHYFPGGPVEVSDPDISNRSGALLYTKIASIRDMTIGTYIVNSVTGIVTNFEDVTTLDESAGTKLVPLTVILKLGDKNCNLLNEPHLSYDESRVVAVFEARENYKPAEDPRNGDGNFDLRNIAIKDATIIMQYLDINAELDEANETCRVSSVDGNIKGLPQCITNSASSTKFDNNKYINTFGIEAFVRCAIQNGQPCDSSNGGWGDDPYDSEYGCYECTIGAAGACAQDHFAIRPKEFYADINGVPFNGDKEIFKAEEMNNIQFKGLTAIAGEETLDYNETQIPETGVSAITDTFYVDANVSNNINCEVKNLTIDPPVHFHDGSDPGPFRLMILVLSTSLSMRKTRQSKLNLLR